MPMSDIRECYRTLELEMGAPLHEVKQAYRDLVKVWHPDRFRSNPQLQVKAEEKLKQINGAYERLSTELRNVDRFPTPKAEQPESKSGSSATSSSSNTARPQSRPNPTANASSASKVSGWVSHTLPPANTNGFGVCGAALMLIVIAGSYHVETAFGLCLMAGFITWIARGYTFNALIKEQIGVHQKVVGDSTKPINLWNFYMYTFIILGVITICNGGSF